MTNTSAPITARVVVNPAARHAASLPWFQLGPNFRTVFEQAHSKAHAVEIVRRSAERGELVVVAGGDGSLTTAVNALAGVSATIGPVPLGPANDSARDNGLPLDPLGAALRIQSGRARAMDVLRINGRRCVSGGGIGLPALSVDTVDALRQRTSLFSKALLRVAGDRVYQAAAARHLLPTPPHLKVRATWTTPEGLERSWNTAISGAFVVNQQTLGRGLILAPNARRDDGVFEICFLRAAPAARQLACLLRLSRGEVDKGDNIVVVRATRARLELQRPVSVFADGEALDEADVVDVELLRGALSLVH